MVLDYRDTVMAFIRSKGPILPVQISKEVKTNILMASAMLSEMSSKGLVKVSHIKVGGSPLYYAPGQEAQLLQFTSHLNEKDQATLARLKHVTVMRDQAEDALTRVSLRNLKDFAHPLNVTHDGTTELFWKWSSLPDVDASTMIKSMLTSSAPAPIQPVVPVQIPTAPPVPKAPIAAVQQPLATSVEKRKRKRAETIAPAQVVMPSDPRTVQPKKEVVQPVAQQTFTPAPVSPIPTHSEVVDDAFFTQLSQFCAKSNIKILECALIKKKSEYDLVLEIPSALGSMVYYAKARNKQKVTDADITAAFVQGQLRKLPAALIAPGELNKKGYELLAKDLRGMLYAQIR